MNRTTNSFKSSATQFTNRAIPKENYVDGESFMAASQRQRVTQEDV